MATPQFNFEGDRYSSYFIVAIYLERDREVVFRFADGNENARYTYPDSTTASSKRTDAITAWTTSMV